MLKNIKRLIIPTLLIILVITFFTRNNFRGVDEIDQESLKNPTRSTLDDSDIIEFTKDDYEYELTPLFNYEVNGLVVNKMDYTLFSIYKRDSVFPMDLCMIWGDNLENKVHQDKDLKFSQDMRFCFVQWKESVNFDEGDLSNNHLLVNNKKIEKKINTISTGDQVKIKGKLVNVKAKNLGDLGKYDPEYFEWNSSTTRTDAGAGACETIYVDDIEILKKSNINSHKLFTFSFYGLILYIAAHILWFTGEALLAHESKDDEEEDY